MPVRELPRYTKKDGSLSPLRYQAYFTDPRGKFRSATVDTIADGERWLAGQQALAEAGVAEPSKVKFGRVADEWLADARPRLSRIALSQAESDVENYLRPALGHRRLCELVPQDMIVLFDRLERAGVKGKPLAATTRRGIRATLSAILGHAINRDLIQRDLLAKVVIRGTRTAQPTPDEAETTAIIRQALRPDTSAFARALALTLNITGMRGGELRALQWGDVDFARRTISIKRAADAWGGLKATKTERSTRTLEGVDVLVLNALAQLRAERDKLPERRRFTSPGDLVFCTGTGRVASHTNLTTRVYHPLQVRAGVFREAIRRGRKVVIGKYGLHAPRRAIASLLHAKGALPLVDISAMLGHADASFTLRTYIGEVSTGEVRGKAVTSVVDGLNLQTGVQKADLKVVSG